MGKLVSLCEYRTQKRQEAEAAEQAELDALRDIVDAWIEWLGEPQSEPFVTLHPIGSAWADWRL